MNKEITDLLDKLHELGVTIEFRHPSFGPNIGYDVSLKKDDTEDTILEALKTAVDKYQSGKYVLYWDKLNSQPTFSKDEITELYVGELIGLLETIEKAGGIKSSSVSNNIHNLLNRLKGYNGEKIVTGSERINVIGQSIGILETSLHLITDGNIKIKTAILLSKHKKYFGLDGTSS